MQAFLVRYDKPFHNEGGGEVYVGVQKGKEITYFFYIAMHTYTCMHSYVKEVETRHVMFEICPLVNKPVSQKKKYI